MTLFHKIGDIKTTYKACWWTNPQHASQPGTWWHLTVTTALTSLLLGLKVPSAYCYPEMYLYSKPDLLYIFWAVYTLTEELQQNWKVTHSCWAMIASSISDSLFTQCSALPQLLAVGWWHKMNWEEKIFTDVLHHYERIHCTAIPLKWTDFAGRLCSSPDKQNFMHFSFDEIKPVICSCVCTWKLPDQLPQWVNCKLVM